jgi:hypothetical protein
MATEIIYVKAEGAGYHPVFHMARLAAELFEAELVVLHRRPLSLLEKASGLLPRRREGVAGVLICPAPYDLTAILSVKNWQKRYGRLVAWVFDSFWPDYLSRVARLARLFDHVFVTEQEDIRTWRGMLRAPVDWLPWGSDTLRLGSANAVRPVDLIRLGRQPTNWEDDASTAKMCTARRIKFQGRPPYFEDASQGERALMNVLTGAKFTLSFSNLVSPGPQTHAKRAYITGRWTDALSAGAVVAGVPPDGESVRSLLWEGALLDLGTLDRAAGLEIIANAVRDWTPQRATQNYARSLQVLDWRWRFERIADALNVRPRKLECELRALRQKINSTHQIYG